MYSKLISSRPKTIIAKLNSLENKQQLMEIANKRKLSTKHRNEKWKNGNIYLKNDGQIITCADDTCLLFSSVSWKDVCLKAKKNLKK